MECIGDMLSGLPPDIKSSLDLLKRRKRHRNDHIYEVARPSEGRPSIELAFFHGLQLKGSQRSQKPLPDTWDSEDGTELWLNWIVEKFPQARILSISYDAHAEKSAKDGHMDMYVTTENLLQDLTEAGIGQNKCPVVLVGHCIGGLVMKELCVSATRKVARATQTRTEPVRNFLDNLKGLFFYASPHLGTKLAEKTNFSRGCLFEDLEPLNKDVARRREEFRELRQTRGWKTYGMVESEHVTLVADGLEIGWLDLLLVHAPLTQGKFKGLIVPEASARFDLDDCYTVSANHFSICRPDARNSSRFIKLMNFIDGVLQESDQVLQARERNRDYFIDSGDRANEVRSMLARSDVHTIFIVGLSGIGKTALARQVYDAICDHFDAKCFVSLDSIERQSNGSDHVWGKILQELEGIDDGSIHNIPRLLHQLKTKNVLMVLDNVESASQLDVLRTGAWLEGSSSKVIVTSTTSGLGNPTNTLKVEYLRSEESEQLFRHYAFQGGEGPRGLRDIIQQVIAKCDNYPLFLKILAGFVSKERNLQEKQLWLELRGTLEKAEEVDGGVDNKLWAKLEVCYNVLLSSEKDIFLDIATTFHGFPLSMVKNFIWQASRECPHKAWVNLRSRFLVSRDRNGIIQMHAQLRYLGRRIACTPTASIEKWKRISGYSLTNQLRQKLSSKKKETMETLSLELKIMENDSFKLNKTTFRNYCHLEYLILEGGRASAITFWGKVKLPRSLVYLRWRDGSFTVCPLDFTGLDTLVVLELLDCKSMESLPASIVEARKLKWLELKGCSSLSKLPRGLPKDLQYLGLERTGLRKLRNDCGDFTKLVDSKASKTQLTRLPKGLGRMNMLAWLDLRWSRVTTLPDSIGGLKQLWRLDLSETMLTSLPESIGQLQLLRELNLEHSSLVSLPETIGLLKGLEELELTGTKLKSLPRSIGDLANLEALWLNNTPLETLPDTVGKLCKLKQLYLVGTRLSTIPETIGELAELRGLWLPTLQSVPQTLGNLSGLRNISIDIGSLFEAWESEEVRQRGEESALAARERPSESHISSFLPQLPFHDATGSYYFSGRGYPQAWVQPLFLALQKMPNHCSLVLRDFNLVETIPCELGTLTSLRWLDIWQWKKLRELPESLGKLSKLEFLLLHDNPSLCRLPESLGKLSNLQSVYLKNNHPSLPRLPESLGKLESHAKNYEEFYKPWWDPVNEFWRLD